MHQGLVACTTHDTMPEEVLTVELADMSVILERVRRIQHICSSPLQEQVEAQFYSGIVHTKM